MIGTTLIAIVGYGLTLFVLALAGSCFVDSLRTYQRTGSTYVAMPDFKLAVLFLVGTVPLAAVTRWLTGV